MLCQSQQKTTQHWLTPLLCFLPENENRKEALRFLQRLDNAMFFTGDTGILMPRCRKYLDGTEAGGLRTMDISDLERTFRYRILALMVLQTGIRAVADRIAEGSTY